MSEELLKATTRPLDLWETLQAKEESESRDVEVPLSPEEPHVHLDLGVEVGPVSVLAALLVFTVLLHFSDCVWNEMHKPLPLFNTHLQKITCKLLANDYLKSHIAKVMELITFRS